MKNLIVIVLCLLSINLIDAQVKFGIRAGVSTQDISPKELNILNADGRDALGIAVKEAKYGLHFGLFTQARMGKFFIQPEVLFNSNSVDFTVQDFSDATVVEQIKSESYQYLDIPVMMGIKLGPLRLQGGPVAHVFINSTSDLFDFDSYDQNFDKLNFGYQAGVGLDLWKIIIDVKYEGSFQKYGDHFNFFGNQYDFDDSPGRLVASVGIAF